MKQRTQILAKNVSYLALVCTLSMLVFIPGAKAVIPTSWYSITEDPNGPGVVLVRLVPYPSLKQPCNAQLGDTVELMVQRLANWMSELKDKHVFNSSKSGDELVAEQIPKLRLFINGAPIRSLKATAWYRNDTVWPWHVDMTSEEKSIPHYFVRFVLTRDPTDSQSREDWAEVLKTPGVGSKMLDLTLGYYHPEQNSAEALMSWVRRGEEDSSRQFLFHSVVTDFWMYLGSCLLVVTLVGFFLLVVYGGIVREPALPVRDDGLPPVSLGRCQMAFWFFLVVAAFIFLWLITGRGDLDTINPTILTLIGISAGTALGAALITTNTTDPGKVAAMKKPDHIYPQEIAPAKRARREAKAALRKAADADAQKKARDDYDQADKKLAELKSGLHKWRREHRNQWLLDLLSEDNDMTKRQIMSFHRFQMIVWTLVLGIIFCSEVYTKLAMPTFDSTLLVLMGISSGTYLGFKFPGASSQ